MLTKTNGGNIMTNHESYDSENDRLNRIHGLVQQGYTLAPDLNQLRANTFFPYQHTGDYKNFGPPETTKYMLAVERP